MKIVVCCKSVPGAVTDVAVAPDGKALQYQSQFNAMNECDEYAIEEALALKSQYGGEITVLTMGGITTQEILYQGLAKGADSAVRIDAQVQDARAASKILAAALSRLDYDLVLTGTQARDTLSSFVGVAIAERLDLPFAFSAVQVEKDGDAAVKVRKELGGGRFADVRLPLPALLCVQTGIQELSYVPPARVMRARQKPLKSMSLADLGLTEDDVKPQGYTFHSVFPPERVSRVEFIEGPASQVAETLMAKIREVL